MRCLSKPCKRFAFAKAEAIAKLAEDRVFQKYSLKYERKLQKLDIKINNDRFITDLKVALKNESGLAHSKTREYWLLRGPRLFCILILAIICNIALAELLKKNPGKDRAYAITNGINLILLSAYMLYHRLEDAIMSSTMRTGRKCYILFKDNLHRNQNAGATSSS